MPEGCGNQRDWSCSQVKGQGWSCMSASWTTLARECTLRQPCGRELLGLSLPSGGSQPRRETDWKIKTVQESEWQ